LLSYSSQEFNIKPQLSPRACVRIGEVVVRACSTPRPESTTGSPGRGIEHRRARRPRLRRALQLFGGARHAWRHCPCPVLSSPAFPVPLPPLFAVGCGTYMGSSPNYLPCDGCGLPASPQHIAERVKRLELSTRFRPVHIGVLFVALAPLARLEDDFYAPPESKEFFNPFLEALEIPSSAVRTAPGSDTLAADTARLAEFQRRGYYLAYLSECPIPENGEPAASTIARLGPTLARRIRFNYKPKHVAPMGQELLPLVDMLKVAKIGPILTLDHGLALPSPRTGGREWSELFRRAVATVAPRENLPSGYDRIQLTLTEQDLGAGGNS